MQIAISPSKEMAIIDGTTYLRYDQVRETVKEALNVSFVGIAQRWQEWSLKTFDRASAESSLCKLQSEIKELIEALSCESHKAIVFEYADCFMCLLHSMAASRISIQELGMFLETKHMINERRSWTFDPQTKTYSHNK
jgi:phosphoribosyl-ATP pyrophosphohydrolase